MRVTNESHPATKTADAGAAASAAAQGFTIVLFGLSRMAAAETAASGETPAASAAAYMSISH